MIKRVTAWTTAATVVSVPLAAASTLPASAVSSATAASASASAAKTISFRGMRLTVPSKWTAHKSDTIWDLLTVQTRPGCDRKKTGCPYFSIGGPNMIHGSNDPNWIGERYNPGRAPFHPETSVMPCRYNRQSDIDDLERFPGGYKGKTVVSGHRQVGKGHKARYYEWAVECYDEKKKRVTRKFVQREWYLRKEKIVIVDGFNTPGLADAIKRATWN
ncbi:hypothetical protein B0I32_11817 [Nonomuraea fuscirosea]|uniref:Secreted protein n=1 Tax=Nonomuraea fuscirosea TaxID=1291556 RepID=A0A2T0MPB5_9ACTN|nr:hypothetical protein [Nonomuraea fuscirosea]PRX59878.1 hypothetical protein B0I32_11817 [Nonomuraea fuscirosea]